uniref:Transposase domain-containing protein n=1 Tax=Bradyrhizobium quebecense TaxID=2748629 RepID=A0A939LH84_9BRAD
MIETCKLNSVSAEHWLSDVLAKELSPNFGDGAAGQAAAVMG